MSQMKDIFNSSRRQKAKKALQKSFKVFKGEGYLEFRSSMFQLQSEKSYFRIRGKTLYWYKSAKSSAAQNKLSLEEAEECHENKQNAKQFELVINDKEYRFTCMNNQEKKDWVAAIRHIIFNDGENQEEEELEDDDFEPLQLGLY